MPNTAAKSRQENRTGDPDQYTEDLKDIEDDKVIADYKLQGLDPSEGLEAQKEKEDYKVDYTNMELPWVGTLEPQEVYDRIQHANALHRSEIMAL